MESNQLVLDNMLKKALSREQQMVLLGELLFSLRNSTTCNHGLFKLDFNSLCIERVIRLLPTDGLEIGPH